MSERPERRANWPHDVPDAHDLVTAVRDHLRDDLAPRTDGRDGYLLRVASNALSIALREMAAVPGDAVEHADRLGRFDVASDAELAASIRGGALDHRRVELADTLWSATLDRLAVANPGYRDETLEP